MMFWLQNSVLIEPRTGPLKFDDLARRKVRYRIFQLSAEPRATARVAASASAKAAAAPAAREGAPGPAWRARASEQGWLFSDTVPTLIAPCRLAHVGEFQKNPFLFTMYHFEGSV